MPDPRPPDVRGRVATRSPAFETRSRDRESRSRALRGRPRTMFVGRARSRNNTLLLRSRDERHLTELIPERPPAIIGLSDRLTLSPIYLFPGRSRRTSRLSHLCLSLLRSVFISCISLCFSYARASYTLQFGTRRQPTPNNVNTYADFRSTYYAVFRSVISIPSTAASARQSGEQRKG